MMATNDKLICTACGGTFFMQGHAEQFQPGGYGTAEFRSVSGAPKTVLVCIGCGTPVVPKESHYARGTVADLAESDFRKSVEAGRKHRKDNSIQNIVKIAASPAELQEVREIIETVRTAVNTIISKPKSKKLILSGEPNAVS